MVLMNFFMPFFFSIMFANSRMISGFCAPFFMREIMGELGTPVIPLSQIIKTTKGTNQSECGAQRHRLRKGRSLFLFLPPHPLFPPMFICSFPLPRGGQAGRWPVQNASLSSRLQQEGLQHDGSFHGGGLDSSQSW